MTDPFKDQMPHPHDLPEDLNDSDIIGVIKIKDGLFICDELGAQVSDQQTKVYLISMVGP
jgi:hypothetical protein